MTTNSSTPYPVQNLPLVVGGQKVCAAADPNKDSALGPNRLKSDRGLSSTDS